MRLFLVLLLAGCPRPSTPDAPTEPTSQAGFVASGNAVCGYEYGFASTSDELRALLPMPDGGALLGGTNRGDNIDDVLLVRTAADGTPQWSKVVSAGDDYDEIDALLPQGDGFVIGGLTWSQGAGMADYWLAKVDATGNPLWQKAYGGPDTDFAYAVSAAADGSFLIGGSSGIVRADSAGVQAWSKPVRAGVTIQRLLPQGTGWFAVGEVANDATGNDGWVAGLDAEGNLLWEKPILHDGFDNLTGGIALPDGDVLAWGTSDLADVEGIPAWVVRFAPDGDIRWQASVNTPGGEGISGAALLPDGSTVLVGDTDTEPYADDLYNGWLIKLDSSGKELMQREYPQVNWRGVVPRADGKLALYGHRNGDSTNLFFQVVSADGAVECSAP